MLQFLTLRPQKKDIHSKEVDLHYMNMEKISSFEKFLRVATYLLRFIANLISSPQLVSAIFHYF